VFGEATGTGDATGVYALSSSTTGYAVYASATATTGVPRAIYALHAADDGAAIYAEGTSTTGSVNGGRFITAADAGKAVRAEADATSGTTYGVYATASSTGGTAIYGKAEATSGTTYGVYALTSSTNGTGIYGEASGTTGSSIGVHGKSLAADGVGVQGNGDQFGVLGSAPVGSGFGVYASGDLAASGTKSCVVRTSQGPTLLYCQESPECWFEDFGRGQLAGGKARIELTPLFLETVTIDAANPMNVFIQLLDDCKGTYVRAGQKDFDVIELQGGNSDARFTYRVVAKRKGYESKRLDICEPAQTDPVLYSELKEVRSEE
jgi:hypothetical protein